MSAKLDLAKLGITIESRVVDGVDLAIFETEVQTYRGGLAQVTWALGVDDDGIRIAHPLGKPPFRGGLAAQPHEVLSGWLSSTARPNLGVLKQTLDEVAFMGVMPAATRTESVLLTSLAAKGHPPVNPRPLLSEILAPLRTRLGDTRTVLHLTNGRDFVPLLMPSRQVEGYKTFVKARPWYQEAASGLSGVDFTAPFEKVERETLEALEVPVGLAPRLGPACHCVRTVRRTLATVPPDWVPARDDVEEWAGLKVLDEVVSSMRVPTWSRAGLLSPVKGRWADYVRKLARDQGFGADAILRLSAKDEQMKSGARSPLAAPASDFHDVSNRLSEFLLEALGIESFELPGLPEGALIGGRGLGAVMELSRRWHADPAFEAGEEIPYREWPSILPSWRDETTGIDVIPLANSVELAREGAKGVDPDGIKGLGHCVGGETYVQGCAKGAMRIVSLRREGARLSTAQIDLDPGETPVLFQHRGLANAVPHAAAEAALERYLALPTVTRAVRPEPDHRTQVTRSAIEANVMAERLEAWRPYLAGDFRHATLETLASIAGIGEAAASPRP